MDTVLLGVIAISVFVMAAIQVAAIVLAARAARRLGATADRIEQDLRPIMANLQAVTSDAARTTALAAATVERADRAIQDASRKVEQALASLPSLIESARDGFNVLAGLRALVNAFRDVRSARRRPAVAEEEDALFIG
ncbi:MAG: hypothetical protein AB7P99_17935 [Vicinamibacterales bacterium]